MKVALVCDWLTNVGGAEKVVLAIHQLFPDAPIYTSQYRPQDIDWFKDADVRTGWLQKFPTKLRRILGPLRQLYFSKLDLSDYDLVISITGAEAKAVKVPNGIHICYCHVPTQYYWQMYDEYIKNPGFGILNPLVRLFFRLLVVPLRHFDLKAAQSPNYFVTISEYAKEQIKKAYGRDATVIHPPVELEKFQPDQQRPPIRLKDGSDLANAYVITSRQVNWKHVEFAVRAAFLSQRHVVVIGEGPEHRRLVKMAKGSELVQFLPLMERDELAKYLAQARGFLFPSLEPFGIAPVEALAAGCPVVAFGEGGAKDYVQPGRNGVLFAEQTPIALAEGILELEKLHLNRKKVSESVREFGLERFNRELLAFIDGCERGEEAPAIEPSKAEGGAGTEGEVAAEDGGGADIEAEAGTEAGVGVGAGTKAKIEAEVKPKTKTEAGVKIGTGVKAGSGEKVKTGSKTKAVAKNKKSRRAAKISKLQLAAKTNTKTVAKTTVKVNARTNVKAAAKANVGANVKAAAETTITENEESRRTTRVSKPQAAVKTAEQRPVEQAPERVSGQASESAGKFPVIREDVDRTRELVKKVEEAKEANRPAFPKIGGKS